MPNLESGYEGTIDEVYLSTKEQRTKTAISSVKIIDAYLKNGQKNIRRWM
jgi:hypothetical protein